MARVTVLCAFAAGLLFAGCAPLVAPPERQWTQVASSHFVVDTDLGADRAREVTEEFEQSYAAMRSFLQPDSDDPPGISHVVVINSAADFALVSREDVGGEFRWRTSLVDPFRFIVFSLNGPRRAREVFQHELTHRFIAHYFPTAPLWANEGLAEFLSTMTVDGNTAVVGQPPDAHWYDGTSWRVHTWQLKRIVPDFEYVCGMPRSWFQEVSGSAYTGAWAFVHVLMEGQIADRRSFEGFIADLRTEVSAGCDTFARHFRKQQLKALRVSYEAFLRRSWTRTETFPISGWSRTKLRTRSLQRSEVHALWGRLLQTSGKPDNRLLALREAELAVKADPRSPEGHLLGASLRIRTDARGAEADLRRGLAFKPDESRLLRALSAVLLMQGRRRGLDALMGRLVSRATSAEDSAVLALWQLGKGNLDRARDWARRATRADAACISCFEIAALAAFQARDLETAILAQRRVIAIAGEHADDRMLATLERYEKKRLEMANPAAR